MTFRSRKGWQRPPSPPRTVYTIGAPPNGAPVVVVKATSEASARIQGANLLNAVHKLELTPFEVIVT